MQIDLDKILYDPMVGKIVTLVVGILVIRVLVGLLQRVFSGRIQSNEARYTVRKTLSLVGYALVIVFTLGLFSDHLHSFTVALGVAGAGIAFALQEVIASVAGWIAVSFGQFYKTGDRVQLGGIRGDVIDIGVLRTTIMEIGEWIRGDAYNGRIVRVANSFVFKEPVFNYSADFPFVWDELVVPVKYGSDYQKAREILLAAGMAAVGDYIPFARETWQQMIKKYMIEEASVEPMVTLMANDNWVEFTLRYVVDFKKRRLVRDQIFLKILEDFEKSSSRVAIASATFHLVETPVFDVRLNPGAPS
ncbi:mechanosensitive ion channel family protein [Trichloromonas sp.]|uniref:mechanosensitive ion channel family protein n=1 Tax=Trichloromonas sp. TaxID=3069249 RepID=UPI003D81BD89